MLITITERQANLVSRNWPEFKAKAGDAEIPLIPVSSIRPDGAGTELKRLLLRAGFEPGNCACDARVAEMDARGVDWCADNVKLICGWLSDEAQKRGLPFPKTAAYLLVLSAIHSARQKSIVADCQNA